MHASPGAQGSAHAVRPAIWMAAVLCLALFVAACPAATSPTPEQAVSPEATATASPTAEPTETPSPSPTGGCESDPSTSLSDGWPRLDSATGAFSFAHPDGWEDITGLVRFSTSSLVDAETFAETGLVEDEPLEADAVRDPAGFPNLAAFALEGVESDAQVIHDRQAERFGGLEELDALGATAMDGCVDGQIAVGMELTIFDRVIDPATGESELTDDRIYQRGWWMVRDEVLYYVQWLDRDELELDSLEEILRTWRWTDGGAAATQPPSGDDPFQLAATAAEVDSSLASPDPATFTSVFTADAPTIYVVYRLNPGLSGTINLTWRYEGQVVFQDSLQLPEGQWAYGGINSAPPGFSVGSWEVELELTETGGSRILEFTVEPAG